MEQIPEAIKKELVELKKQLQLQGNRQDDERQQLDTDRANIDQIILDLERNTKTIETLYKQMEDFKDQIRLTVRDTIQQELPSAVKTAVQEELANISVNNPKKSFVVYYGLPELIKTIVSKIKNKIYQK